MFTSCYIKGKINIRCLDPSTSTSNTCANMVHADLMKALSTLTKSHIFKVVRLSTAWRRVKCRSHAHAITRTSTANNNVKAQVLSHQLIRNATRPLERPLKCSGRAATVQHRWTRVGHQLPWYNPRHVHSMLAAHDTLCTCAWQHGMPW